MRTARQRRSNKPAEGLVIPVLIAVVALAATGVTARAEEGASERSADEIQQCVRANLPSRSSIQEVAFRVNGKAGATTNSRVKIYWQKGDDGFSNVLLSFEAPADMRGSALLLVEKPERNDMFMYLPELKRVRRVTGPALSGGMFGTDFTFAQFERLQGVSRDLKVERLPDAELDGRTVHVLANTPADDPEFEYVKSYVDRERCLPLRTEFYESGRRLRKVLDTVESGITRVGDQWIPHRLVMRDVVQGTSTEFNVERIDVNAAIHRKTFTQANLGQGN